MVRTANKNLMQSQWEASGVLISTYNTSTQEAEAEGSPEFKNHLGYRVSLGNPSESVISILHQENLHIVANWLLDL